ncbi:MAG TPA: hemerythrin domain-containing protein [Acidimicrobiia bacterium]|nr:hemerythrin domain-containing protein [Acidimicrobiia bacterium]
MDLAPITAFFMHAPGVPIGPFTNRATWAAHAERSERSNAMTQLNHSETDVVDAIRKDHREIEQMLAAVESAQGTAKKDAFDQLARKLSAHEAAEEEVVHPLTEDLGATDVAASVEMEESEASVLLSDMASMDVASSEFEAAFQKLKLAVMAHARHEESEEHPRLKENESPDYLVQLADEYESAEEEAMGRA